MDSDTSRGIVEQWRPEDVLRAGALMEYRRAQKGIAEQLFWLNTYLVILRKLDGFPFNFLGEDPSPLWATVERAFVDESVLCIWSAWIDKSRRGYTLERLYDHVSMALRNDSLRDVFRKAFEEIPVPKPEVYERLITEIRHSYIAHFDLAKHVSPTRADVEARAITLRQLEDLAGHLNDLFDLLCMNEGWFLKPDEYDPSVTVGSRAGAKPDIDRVLDLLAKDSFTVNLPERAPVRWYWEEQRIADADREKLNDFRLRFGLPQV